MGDRPHRPDVADGVLDAVREAAQVLLPGRRPVADEQHVRGGDHRDVAERPRLGHGLPRQGVESPLVADDDPPAAPRRERERDELARRRGVPAFEVVLAVDDRHDLIVAVLPVRPRPAPAAVVPAVADLRERHPPERVEDRRLPAAQAGVLVEGGEIAGQVALRQRRAHAVEDGGDLPDPPGAQRRDHAVGLDAHRLWRSLGAAWRAATTPAAAACPIPPPTTPSTTSSASTFTRRRLRGCGSPPGCSCTRCGAGCAGWSG